MQPLCLYMLASILASSVMLRALLPGLPSIVFRRASLICTECPRSRRDLLWVSLACLNTRDKVALRCPRPWRGLSNSAVSSMGCLKHRDNFSLISWCLVPTPKERPITTASYRPRVSENTKTGASYSYLRRGRLEGIP